MAAESSDMVCLLLLLFAFRSASLWRFVFGLANGVCRRGLYYLNCTTFFFSLCFCRPKYFFFCAFSPRLHTNRATVSVPLSRCFVGRRLRFPKMNNMGEKRCHLAAVGLFASSHRNRNENKKNSQNIFTVFICVVVHCVFCMAALFTILIGSESSWFMMCGNSLRREGYFWCNCVACVMSNVCSIFMLAWPHQFRFELDAIGCSQWPKPF